MKQSIRAWIPSVSYSQSVKKILNEGINPIVFEQNSDIVFTDIIHEIKQETGKQNLLFFGPEGGFTDEEVNLFEKLNRIRLTENRLRSESAIITAAALLSASK
jgi:16S rRNA (uracil1498-N3)-methyltransferase